MEKQTIKKKEVKGMNVVSLPVVNPDAAGIDVAAKLHAVAVPPGRDSVNVKEFGAFTEDLIVIAAWLKKCKVATVAMESTGVYWRQLYLVLIEHGFEVSLVNAKHVKNVTGRKTTARKIAIIYYKMVRYKKGFMPMGTEEYRENYKIAKIAWLEKQISKLKTTAA